VELSLSVATSKEKAGPSAPLKNASLRTTLLREWGRRTKARGRTKANQEQKQKARTKANQEQEQKQEPRQKEICNGRAEMFQSDY
jgi:hypothetical protein